MSKYSSTRRTVALLVAIISSVALVAPDFFALTYLNQNTNSSTTMEQNENTSMGGSMHSMGRRRRGRKRGMRRRGMRRHMRGMAANTSDANMSAPADTSGAMAANTSTSGGMTDDLSGTYSGTLNMPEHNMSGPATLTVTGSSYTLDAGSMQHSGRFVANTTRGYTAVTAEIGPTDAGQTPMFVSLRARRLGNGGLSLMSVPGEMHKFSFTTAGGGRMGRRGRRGMRSMPANMDMGGNANTTSDTPMTTGDNTNTGDMSGNMNMGRRRGRRRGRRPATNMNMNENMNMNSNNNMTP